MNADTGDSFHLNFLHYLNICVFFIIFWFLCMNATYLSHKESLGYFGLKRSRVTGGPGHCYETSSSWRISSLSPAFPGPWRPAHRAEIDLEVYSEPQLTLGCWQERDLEGSGTSSDVLLERPTRRSDLRCDLVVIN